MKAYHINLKDVAFLKEFNHTRTTQISVVTSFLGIL